jgi:hypothetical protein
MSNDESSSSSSTSVSNDPFAFTAHKFQHKKAKYSEDETTDGEDDEESREEYTTTKKKSIINIEEEDDDDDEEEAAKAIKSTSKNNILPAEVVYLLDDDDEDDDDDDTPQQQTNSTYTTYNKNSTLYTDAAFQNSTSLHSAVPPPITAEIQATMQRAHHARDLLLRAQRNQIAFDQQLPYSAAQEITAKEQAYNMVVRDQQMRHASVQQQHKSYSAPAAPKGNLITLFLRSSLSLNNTKSNNNNTTPVKAYTLEPLQTPLIDNYLQNYHQGSISEVCFKFDGETLKLSRTPQSYDMEDGDLIDVVRFVDSTNTNNYGTPSAPSQVAASKVTNATTFSSISTTTNSGRDNSNYKSSSTLNIILRTRIVHHKKNNATTTTTTTPTIRQWQLRRTDCLDKLIQAYRKEKNIISSGIDLFVENNKIDATTRTPLVLGLNDYSLLDMHVYDDNDEVFHPEVPQQTTTANMIRLILRINGNDTTKEEYIIHKKDKFEQLHEAFCKKLQQKNKVFNSVKLTLDGSVLSLSDTCQDEDLEGGEIIDVICR